MRYKLPIAMLTLSAAGFVGILQSEDYVETATIPTKNDRPTNGFGMTVNPDGTPVKLGDKTTPTKAVKRSFDYLQKSEAQFKRCVRVELAQEEYDLYNDFGYQFGMPTLCGSSIVEKLNRYDYIGACHALLLYKYSGGYDCSAPGNKTCGGVWTRQQARHKKCLAAQEGGQ